MAEKAQGAASPIHPQPLSMLLHSGPLQEVGATWTAKHTLLHSCDGKEHPKKH